MSKRILSMLLIVVMLLGILPASVFAAEATPVEPASIEEAAPQETLSATAPEAEPQADTLSENPIKQLTVRTKDSEGNYIHYNSAKQDTTVSDSDYWAYLVPGITCPTTIPEAEVKASAWNNCNDYVYTWDNGSYVLITLPEAYSVSKIEWDSNVLKFTVSDAEGQSKDFTLTMKQLASLSGTTMEQLKQNVADALKTNMAESFDQISARVSTIEVPEGIQLKLITSKNGFNHTATAGTKDAPEGQAATISLNVEFSLVDEIKGSTIDISQSNGLYYQTLSVVDEPLTYSEADKATVTAEANGDGTVTAEFSGMVAQAQADKSYKLVSQYDLTATQNEGQRFIVWLYGDAKQTNYTQNPTITATADTTYTAYFVENQAPTAKKDLSLTIQARNYKSQSLYGYFNTQHKVEVDGKIYSKNVMLTYTATLDGEPMNEETLDTARGEYFNGTSGNFKLWPGNEMIGEHTIVITAHDDLGATAELTVPYTVTAGNISEYKLRLVATKAGEDYPLGEGGLNAKITYKAGPSYQYLLDNLDNEYYDSTNKYFITIDNWSEIAEANDFYMLKVGSVEIPAADLPTRWTGYQLFGARDGFRVNYAASMDQLQMYVNVNANMTITEDLTVELLFSVPATYTPTVTVSAAGGGIIDSLKLYKNTEEGSIWTLTTTPNLSWLLDYIQIGDDESSRITSEDSKTIRFTVSADGLAYTAYFRETPKAVLTDNWKLGAKGDYARRSTSFGEKGYFTFKKYSSYTVTTDYPNETDKNTLLYTELVNLVTEVTFQAEYPAGSVFQGVLYNGEGTTGTVLDSREATLATALVPGDYGVDFTFNLPENPEKVTMVLTLGAGSDKEFSLTKTFDLTETGITFRAPVESDYAKVVVQVGHNIGPTMVKDFKFYGGLKFLLGAYEDVIEKEADKGYKSIIVDNYGGFMNCVVLSYDEPEIKGSVYTEKNLGSGTWGGMVTYYVNGVFVDLGIGSWSFYGDEIMQWNGLYKDKAAPHEAAITSGDPWGVAVLRQYYSDDDLIAAGVGSTLLTNEAMAEKYPDHADEILGRKTVPDAIKPTFDEIKSKIDAIGEVTKDSAAAITAAREAYIALPKTFFNSATYFPTLFTNTEPYKTSYATLKAAEAALAAIKDPDELVENLIAAIGDVSLSSGNAILAARQAYDALEDSWKEQVDNYETLTAAEAAYTALQAAELAKLPSTADIYTSTGDYLAANTKFKVGSTGGEWAVLGLSRAGKTIPDLYYSNVLTYVAENIDEDNRLDANKASENARLILALTAMGMDVTNVDGHNLLKGLNDMEYIQTQGINGVIFTLIALDAYNYTPYGDVTRAKLTQALLDAQLEDGGWTLFGTEADVDITAMALQALAPYYDTDEAVKAAADRAIATLSTLQNADGSFNMNDGSGILTPTAESTAQVITALAALKIDPATDGRFVKYGSSAVDGLRKFYVTGGGFAHDSSASRNDMATEQGYYSLVAASRLANGKTRLYDMTDLTIERTNITVQTTLTDGATYRNAHLTFDVIAKDGDGEKISVSDVTVTLNGDPVKHNWDDTQKTSYTLDFTEGENIVEVKVLGKVLTYTLHYIPAAEGEVIGQIVVSVEAFTLGGGYIIEPCYVDILAGEDAAQLLVRVLTANGLTYTAEGADSRGFYLEDIKGEKLSTIDVNGDTIPAELKAKLTENKLTISKRKDANRLGEFDYTKGSGWMFCMNNIFPNVSFSSIYPADGDIMRVQFTLAYGSDVNGGITSLLTVANKDALTEKIAQINAALAEKPNYLKDNGMTKSYEAAMAVLTNLTSTQAEVDAALAALVPCEHVWKDATCTDPAICEKCGAEKGEPLPHDCKDTVVAPTCLTDGYTEHVCTRCNYTYRDTIVPAAGHDTTDTIVKPTHEAMGYTVTKCANCDYSTVHTFVDALDHDYKRTVTKEATCLTEGEWTFTCDCSDSYTMAIPTTCHNCTTQVVVPTCTEQGYTVYTCETCGLSYISDFVAATGHSLLEEVIAPTCTEQGYTIYTCEHCDYTTIGAYVPAIACPSGAFTDVNTGAWYHAAVDYAITNKLMNGTSATTFEPESTTTRAMLATLLYRIAGSPDVSGLENPFTDVPATQWYCDAVIWAFHEGVVTGATATTFNPDGEITREQLAVMLWRYAGKPEADAAVLDGFTDATLVDSYARNAVAWAVEAGLINGVTASTLEPIGTATRAQIATILMRYLES